MNIIDISWPISKNITAYKDKSVVHIEHTKVFERDNARESVLRIGAHTGTHVDAPSHFMEYGATVEQLPLDATLGHCVVLDCMYVTERIEREDLESMPISEGDIVLFKTTNSLLSAEHQFNYNFVYVAKSAAEYLVERKIKTVGIDYLGIERNQPDHITHTLFMENHITIIEGLRLANVSQGSYVLVCLPLLLPGLEAAPARAVLIRQE